MRAAVPEAKKKQLFPTNYIKSYWSVYIFLLVLSRIISLKSITLWTVDNEAGKYEP